MRNFFKKIPKKLKIAIIAIILLFLIIMFFIPNPMNGNVSLLTRISNALSGITEQGFSYEIYGYDEDSGLYNLLLNIENPDGIKEIKDLTKDTVISAQGRNNVAIDYVVEDFTDYKFDITLMNGTVQNQTFHFERTRYGKDTYKNKNGVYANTPNLEGYEDVLTRYLQYSSAGVLQPGNWITDEEPTNWYDYTAKDSEGNQSPKWANIYTENDGVEAYYVWIPRYCYKFKENNVAGNERVDIKFIDVFNNYDSPTEGKLTWDELKAYGYKIPEAFEFGTYKECSLSGFWISKYKLSDLAGFSISYNLASTSTSFNVSNLTNNTDKTIAKYTFAINGKVESHFATTEEDYVFSNNILNGENTVNVTALDSDGRIIGSMTKKVVIANPNPPDLTGFNKNVTYYVYWDSDGTEHNDTPISQPAPSNWYDYSASRWANIATKGKDAEGNESLSYFVWIPRYQYRLNQTNQRTKIRFIIGTSTETLNGYQIPEAFTWEVKPATEATEIEEAHEAETVELTGYWISKYKLTESN